MHVYIYIVSGPNHFIFWNPFSKVDWPEKSLQERLKEVFPNQQACCITKLVKTKGRSTKKQCSRSEAQGPSRLSGEKICIFLVVEPGLDVTNLGSDATNIT